MKNIYQTQQVLVERTNGSFFVLRVKIQRQTSGQELWTEFDLLFPERNKLTTY